MQACQGDWRLADGAHQPVLQISKSKTVNYHMQVAMGQAVKENFLNPVILVKGNYHVTIK
jgi:hypothetical protein